MRETIAYRKRQGFILYTDNTNERQIRARARETNRRRNTSQHNSSPLAVASDESPLLFVMLTLLSNECVIVLVPGGADEWLG